MKNVAMLLGVALLLAACDGAPTTPETSQPARGPTVTGTVIEEDPAQPTYPNLTLRAWSGGAGTVSGSVSDAAGKTTVVATGTLNADGGFSLSLPATLADASLSSLGTALDLQANPLAGELVPGGLTCTAALVPSDAAARGAGLLVTVTAGQKTGPISSVLQSGQFDETAQSATLDNRSGAYLYSDRAVSISGTQTCTGTSQGTEVRTTLNSNVTLSQGWNLLSVNTNLVANRTSVTMTVTAQTGELPTNQWLYSSGTLAPLGLPRLR